MMQCNRHFLASKRMNVEMGKLRDLRKIASATMIEVTPKHSFDELGGASFHRGGVPTWRICIAKIRATDHGWLRIGARLQMRASNPRRSRAERINRSPTATRRETRREGGSRGRGC